MRLIKPDEWASYYSELRGYHDRIATRTEYDMGYTDALDRVDDWMDGLPTVDAVEVVRCKDCKHFDMHRMECQNDAIVTDNEGGADFTVNFDPDDFCSYGERKDYGG